MNNSLVLHEALSIPNIVDKFTLTFGDSVVTTINGLNYYAIWELDGPETGWFTQGSADWENLTSGSGIIVLINQLQTINWGI